MKHPACLQHRWPPSLVPNRRAAAGIGLVALIAVGPVAGEVTSSLASGMYQGSFTSTIAGERQPPETDHQCFTQSDLDHLETWLATMMGEGCSAVDLRSSAPVTTFEVACQGDGGQVSTRVELTTGTDSFKAVITTTEDLFIEKLEAVLAIDARRVGDCTPESAE